MTHPDHKSSKQASQTRANSDPRRLQIVHTTRFYFDAPMSRFKVRARLTPRDPHWQVDFRQLVLRPLADKLEENRDIWGNRVDAFELAGPLQRLEVTSIHVISERPTPESRPLLSEPEAGDSWLVRSPAAGPSDAARSFWPAPAGDLSASQIEMLWSRIRSEFRIDASSSEAHSTAEDALRRRSGVCHDLAHVAIACLRSHKIPAGFVWGYRIDDSKQASSSRRAIGRDLSHAWVTVWLPGEGWREFDPSFGCWVGDRYIGVARGRDLGDAQAVEGEFTGSVRQRMEVQIDIQPLEAARPEG